MPFTPTLVKPCAAIGCEERILRRLLMCPRHWRMVPLPIQDRVITTLQEWRQGESARRYVYAVAEAQLAVARKENQTPEVIAALEAEVARYGTGVSR